MFIFGIDFYSRREYIDIHNHHEYDCIFLWFYIFMRSFRKVKIISKEYVFCYYTLIEET